MMLKLLLLLIVSISPHHIMHSLIGCRLHVVVGGSGPGIVMNVLLGCIVRVLMREVLLRILALIEVILEVLGRGIVIL
jgi:hypothetical protein